MAAVVTFIAVEIVGTFLSSVASSVGQKIGNLVAAKLFGSSDEEIARSIAQAVEELEKYFSEELKKQFAEFDIQHAQAAAISYESRLNGYMAAFNGGKSPKDVLDALLTFDGDLAKSIEDSLFYPQAFSVSARLTGDRMVLFDLLRLVGYGEYIKSQLKTVTVYVNRLIAQRDVIAHDIGPEGHIGSYCDLLFNNNLRCEVFDARTPFPHKVLGAVIQDGSAKAGRDHALEFYHYQSAPFLQQQQQFTNAAQEVIHNIIDCWQKVNKSAGGTQSIFNVPSFVAFSDFCPVFDKDGKSIPVKFSPAGVFIPPNPA